MQELTVSVVIPTYNREHLIARALRSVLREIRTTDEVLVVDDGSTDRTCDVVRGFADDRIRYIRQSNAGAGAARNRGANEAKGDLLCYLDSDDEWLPGKVELQRRFMSANPNVLFCFTNFAREYGGRRYPRSIASWHTDTRSWDQITGSPARPFSACAELPSGVGDFSVYAGDIYRGEMHTNYILTSCIMIRRREAGDAIHFTEGVKTFEDWECFGRLAGRGTAAFLDYESAVQFGHPGPRLTDANLLVCAESRLVVLQRVWGSDPHFLASHGDEYRGLVQAQQEQRIRGLLVEGRTRDARQAIAQLKHVPATYRFLSMLPGSIATSVLSARRVLKGERASEANQGIASLDQAVAGNMQAAV